jgi:hypothetical protein
MRYQFMLEIDNIDEQRKKIIKLQNQLRQYGEWIFIDLLHR